jgi:hypothetical protein
MEQESYSRTRRPGQDSQDRIAGEDNRGDVNSRTAII